jgi:RluA family pseudouridine synthase
MNSLSITISKNINQTIVDYLAERYTYQNREEWTQRICRGEVLLNGKPVEPLYKVCEGSHITFDISAIEEPEVNTNFSLLYEDSFLFAVNKPPDLPVHPTGRYCKNTLTSLLKEKLHLEPFIINRLDRETSGIVLFAKDHFVAGKLGKLFSERNVVKTYLVYVYGSFEPSVRLIGNLVKDETSLIRKKKKLSLEEPIDPTSSLYTETSFTKVSEQDRVSKLVAKPKTGRTHQIRASLFSHGFPVLGDKIYGRNEEIFLDFIKKGCEIYSDPRHCYEFQRITRQALHSSFLGFIHPITNQRVEIECEEPEDLKNIFKSGFMNR